MKWIAIIAAALVAVVLIVAIVGWMQPVKHRASRAATFRATPAELYALITGIDAFPAWRTKIRSVERQSLTRFREVGGDGAITYDVEEQTPNQRLVTRIADPSLPFGGSWTYELVPRADGSTTLRITEDGEVYNPIFRFVSRFVMGHTATIDQYLRDVGRRLAQDPVIGP